MRYLPLVLILLSSCYPSPGEDTGTVCRSNAGALFNRPDQCTNFQRHEDVALEAFTTYTPQWNRAYLATSLSGISVVVLSDSEIKHDKDGRAYFTEPSLPNFRVWGETWCPKPNQDGKVKLADANFKSGVLAHEFGHLFMGCGMNDHQEMETNGVNAAIAYVQQHYDPAPTLSGATGNSGLYSLPPNTTFITLSDGRHLTGAWAK